MKCASPAFHGVMNRWVDVNTNQRNTAEFRFSEGWIVELGDARLAEQPCMGEE